MEEVHVPGQGLEGQEMPSKCVERDEGGGRGAAQGLDEQKPGRVVEVVRVFAQALVGQEMRSSCGERGSVTLPEGWIRKSLGEGWRSSLILPACWHCKCIMSSTQNPWHYTESSWLSSTQAFCLLAGWSDSSFFLFCFE